MRNSFVGSLLVACAVAGGSVALAQVPPSTSEKAAYTGLFAAAARDDAKDIERLAAGGADAGARDTRGRTPLHVAAFGAHPDAMRALAIGGRPGNVTSRYDGTALIAASHLGHAEVVRVLIRAGAPLDHVNNLGWTALIESMCWATADRAIARR